MAYKRTVESILKSKSQFLEQIFPAMMDVQFGNLKFYGDVACSINTRIDAGGHGTWL